MQKKFLALSLAPVRIAVFIITIYQLVLSPDHGWLFRSRYPYGFCHFYPTCSEYTKQVILKFGIFKGILLGFYRILRCNPWTSPQIDLPT